MKTTRARNLMLVGLVAMGLLAGCTSNHSAKATPPSTTAPPSQVPGVAPLVSAGPATPKSSPTAAVTALLDAEKAGDHVTSFGLVDPAGRAVYPAAVDWERRRAELAPITSFKVESTKDSDVTVLVDHKPGIDPFIGLHFAQEHQVWHAVKVSGGWLVDPDPKITPILGSDDGARTAALAWAKAVQSCDRAAAARLQALPNLLGESNGPNALCHATGNVTADPPAAADQGPQTADLVAQYTVDVLAYVRKVHIGGIPAPFNAYLVPIGTDWQVVAISD